jgi:hypothetical protein
MKKRSSAYTFDRSEVYARLFLKQRGKCAACRAFSPHLTIDHKIPRDRGGADVPSNMHLLCRACNSSKGAKQSAGDQHTIFDKPDARTDNPPKDSTGAGRQRAYRARARAAGLCIICCREPVPPGRSTCHACGSRVNAFNAARRPPSE